MGVRNTQLTELLGPRNSHVGDNVTTVEVAIVIRTICRSFLTFFEFQFWSKKHSGVDASLFQLWPLKFCSFSIAPLDYKKGHLCCCIPIKGSLEERISYEESNRLHVRVCENHKRVRGCIARLRSNLLPSLEQLDQWVKGLVLQIIVMDWWVNHKHESRMLISCIYSRHVF